MRKNIIGVQAHPEKETKHEWIDLEKSAQVEISSEDSSHPVEGALQLGGRGWRASVPGPQLLRLLFDRPQNIRRITLRMKEEEQARAQEFVLRWSQDNGWSFREIVRQQYNFSPPGTTIEEEEYEVDLAGVTVLELEINPDINGSGARASLSSLRLA